MHLTPWVYRALRCSLSYKPLGVDVLGFDSPVIFACLHRDILVTIPFVAPARPSLLISRSRDGEILIRTLARDGFDFVRGSTGKEGGAAFRGLLERIQAGRNVGIAVDGPRGPFGHVHGGVVRLAAVSGAPIIPLIAEPGWHIALRTWDRTIAPLPFSRIRMHVADPILVPREIEEITPIVERLRSVLLRPIGAS